MFLKRSLYSLRYRWKKVLAYILTYSVLFSLCFGAIMVYSTVQGQRGFLQGALQRAVTLRGEEYYVRVDKNSAGYINSSIPYEKLQPFLQDEAVEDWNTCRQFPLCIEGCDILYAEERARSYEEHHYGQIANVHEDGTTALCVRDSARSQAFLTTGFQLVEGEHFTSSGPEDVILVSEDFARLNHLHAGSRVKVSNIQNDERFEPFSGELTVCGIFRAPESGLMKGIGARPEEMAVIPYSLFSRFWQRPVDSQDFRFVTFYLREGADQEAFMERLGETFPIKQVVDDFFHSYSRKPPEEAIGMNFDEMAVYLEAHPAYQLQMESQWYDMVAKPLDQEAKLAGAMAALLLESVALIIALTVVLSVKERRREVGILLSMGESKVRVIGQLAIETAAPLLLSLLIGIGAGTAAGVPVAEGLCNGVYEQTAADSESENKNLTFNAVQGYYDNPWSLSERQLYWTLSSAVHLDIEVFPQAQAQADPQAAAAYAGILLTAALLALLGQSGAILAAKPAKILLNRR